MQLGDLRERYRIPVESGTEKVKDLDSDTCYSAAYTRETQEQQCFTISEVAADWHELLIPQRIMRPSIARANDN